MFWGPSAEEKYLNEALKAFESTGCRDLTQFWPVELRGIDVTKRPLVLLWPGDESAGQLVRYALACWNVVGIVHPASHASFYGMKFSSKEEFDALTQNYPDLVGILFGREEKYKGWCKDAKIPCVDAALTLPAAGMSDLPAKTAPLIRENLRLMERLADKVSKRTLAATILHRLTLDPAWLDEVSLPSEKLYFGTGLLSFKKDEVFIDGGASLGDTLETFTKLTDGKYGHIHCFEPSPIGFGLTDRIARHFKNVTVHKCGLSSGTAEVGFRHDRDGNAINGVVDSNSSETVKLEAIDNLDLGPVSFIKLDIEGFEVEALRGAANTIRKYKPKLAICAYHKPEDFYEILDTIDAIRNDYTFHMRHHSPNYTDTVYYAY
jgi:FkbM family methyltransferase